MPEPGPSGGSRGFPWAAEPVVHRTRRPLIVPRRPAIRKLGLFQLSVSFKSAAAGQSFDTAKAYQSPNRWTSWYCDRPNGQPFGAGRSADP